LSSPYRSGSRFASFQYAFKGMWYVIRTQRNSWIHLSATIIVVVMAIWLKLESLEWSALVLAIGLVWTAEFFNTAIETIVDLASPEHHRLAGIAKDLAAAAVLTATLTAIAIGLLILLPPLVGRVSWLW
jgi:diacylglycerol kinase